MKSLSFNRSVLFVIVRRRMETRLLLILFFSALACHTGADLPRPISVKNGGVFGDWGPLRVCPKGTIATAFSIKVEEESWFDNTALNGIKLYCGDKNSTETVIESTTEKYCIYIVIYNLIFSPLITGLNYVHLSDGECGDRESRVIKVPFSLHSVYEFNH